MVTFDDPRSPMGGHRDGIVGHAYAFEPNPRVAVVARIRVVRVRVDVDYVHVVESTALLRRGVSRTLDHASLAGKATALIDHCEVLTAAERDDVRRGTTSKKGNTYGEDVGQE